MNRRNLIKGLGLSAGSLAMLPKDTVGNILNQNALKKSDFGKDFLWGVATAAYQIEGAHNLDGKGESIWDKFSHTKGKIKNGENGDTACDFYHNYGLDLDILKSLNMNVFRFSTAWSRVLPNGTGQVNQKGVDYYHRVIDKCLENGIQPWPTLYHWDLPQALQDKGGWMNRDVISWFSEYSNLLTKTYGDKVKNWMVLNEPMAYTGLGYLLGYHAPGVRGIKHFVAAAHHTAMCQAEGGRIIRSNVKGANVGTTFSCSYIMPWKSMERDHIAVKRWDAFINRFYIEPALGLGYPTADLPFLKKIEKFIIPGDMEKLPFDFDFIGVQNYTREVAKKMWYIPYMHGLEVPPKKRGVAETTEMNWEVYPEGIYKIIKQFASYKGVKKIIVTENGCSFPDFVLNNEVHDIKRVNYYQQYLEQVLRAKNDGVNLGGYFSWSLMDNFEWSEGYKPRFGLVYTDFATQKRIVKDSGLWFREFLK
jgi:beta-glucosidase